jgi:SAM-dependent methyltransferase
MDGGTNKMNYDPVIGYSPLDRVDIGKLRRLVGINRRILDDYYSPRGGDRVLVAGAGNGEEAALIHREYRCATVGVDIHLRSADAAADLAGLSFLQMDLENLAFADGSFAMIYCYHVLEHVSNHVTVLREFHRVLGPAGVLFIGFPNRHRLFSYFGTSQKASVAEKISWNFKDYADRFRGRFENKFGAHAGFTEKEFLRDVTALFGTVHAVRNQYMQLKYVQHLRLINAAIRSGLAEYLFPSNYFVCVH